MQIPKAANMLRAIATLIEQRAQPVLDQASEAEIEGMRAICRNPSIDNSVREVIVAAHDRSLGELGLAGLGERPPAFWETDAILCTREGIHRRREELRVLRDVKLPENSEAIRRAAALGDLSENAEWEAAMEEQRQLTAKAEELVSELRRCQELESQAFDADHVTPGCKVRYRDVERGSSRVITILGPWDIDRDGVVSYKAPIARAMLGKQMGDEVVARLPGEERRLVIESFENAVLFLPGEEGGLGHEEETEDLEEETVEAKDALEAE